MLRLNDTIRLNDDERKTLAGLAGAHVSGINPTTVAQHDAIVRRAKESLEDVVRNVKMDVDDEGVDHSGHAEARLLAAISGTFLLGENPGEAGVPSPDGTSCLESTVLPFRRPTRPR